MPANAVSRAILGVTALAAGSIAALVWGWDHRPPRGAAAVPLPQTVQRGESGLSLRQEEAAVVAVRAHLRDARGGGELSDIRLYPQVAADEIVVCGLLPMSGSGPGSGAGAMRVVARVVLNQPAAAARSPSATPISAPPILAMVILEAGPGLGRGGSQQGPVLRYCRDPHAVDAAPAAAPGLVDAEAAAGPPGRVMVVSAVRVRAGPASDAAILWTAPRGRSYAVLGQAPGGWIHLGDGETALGWAHSSLLTPPP